MTGTDVLVPLEQRIEDLARRHEAAQNLAMRLVNAAGSQMGSALSRVPAPLRQMIDGLTAQGIERATDVALQTRKVVPDQRDWVNTLVSTGMGAAGGAGGLATAAVEIPMTITVLLRAIQGVAAQHGFDPSDPETLKICVSVFGSAGPLAKDDDAELGFLSARLALNGVAMKSIIARVAPRLGFVLGQKLASQTVPVLGAAAGATANYAYMRYYQEMAHVVFGLRKLSRETGHSYPSLVLALDEAVRSQNR